MFIITNSWYFVFIRVSLFGVNIRLRNNSQFKLTLAEGGHRLSKKFKVTLQKPFCCITCSIPFAWFSNKNDVTFFVQMIIFFVSMIQMLLIAWESYNSMKLSFSTIPYLIRAGRMLCCRKKEKVKTWLRKRSRWVKHLII